MTEIKLNIGHKGKNYAMSFENILEGKKIGDKVPGDFFGLDGYELEITGGSDMAGFPMRKDIEGMGRKKPLAVSGIGFKSGNKSDKIRKTVVGNTVGARISQVNFKVVKEGSKKLEEIFKKEEKKEE